MSEVDWIGLTARALGGLGLFLLGMIIMTDALRQLAGDSLRRFLLRFTHSPISGAVSGAVSTAVLQSSSATIVATVGFVGAGIIGFTEALGVIFGANLGTTITGWLVVMFGLKLQLADVLLPFILLGAMTRLFARGRLAHAGMALASFGLVIQGIALMQAGMSGMPTILTPEMFPANSFQGRALLVLLGIAATLITQSSSAGVAATVTALFAGAINFEQAAALVIGMDIGTTVTAALATIGGTVGARRTGLSHVIYNCMTGTVAFFLITPFMIVVSVVSADFISTHGEVALVLFHTTFNLLGVIIILPFTANFARLIKRLIKNGRHRTDYELDESLLMDSDIALTSLSRKVTNMFMYQLKLLMRMLEQPGSARTRILNSGEQILRTRSYIGHMHIRQEQESEHARLVAMIHILDHMNRLNDRCQETDDAEVFAQAVTLRPLLNGLKINLQELTSQLEQSHWQMAEQYTLKFVAVMREELAELRRNLVQQAAVGEQSVEEATHMLDAIRWLDRSGQHIERISHYLNQMMLQQK